MRSDEAAEGGEPATLQTRLEDAEQGSPASAPAVPTIADPVALLRHLDESGRFHRDGRLGRMYHAGMVSLREDVPTDSLHISIEGNRLTAHIDEVSPLAVDPAGDSRYSARRAVAHNLSGMARDLVSLLRGTQGDHRCELDCEWVTDEAPDTAGAAPRLHPRTTAWSVHVEARVAGTIDEARLRTALGVTVGMHPLPGECLEVVACRDDEACDDARSRLHAMGVPATLPPLRALLARHPGGDVLMLSVNHAASDGVGALVVLDRIARAYAAREEVGAPLDFLAGRDLPVRPASSAKALLARTYKSALARLQGKLIPPARLAADGPAGRNGTGFHLVALSPEQTRDAHGDVLLAALHLAIADWNHRHDEPGGRIGVLVPADLRPEDWRAEVIGNFSVNSRVSTAHRSRTSPAAALKSITAQGARNTRTRTGIALIAALERAGMLALWAKQSSVVLEPLTANHLIDTALLCSLDRVGEAPQFGADAGATVELWFSAPSRSPLCLCIGAVTVGERLHLTFRHPHRLLGREGARRFAACYVEHLRAVVAAARA